ncbi:MAG: hypothetical protein ACLKAK_07165 [Alkaliphilus sp.]
MIKFYKTPKVGEKRIIMKFSGSVRELRKVLEVQRKFEKRYLH